MCQGFFTKNFHDDFGTTASYFMDCFKIYIYCDNIRRYHCIVWEKTICNICIYQRETDTLIRIILEDATALHEKSNLHHLYMTTRNWFIYWNENGSHCAP